MVSTTLMDAVDTHTEPLELVAYVSTQVHRLVDPWDVLTLVLDSAVTAAQAAWGCVLLRDDQGGLSPILGRDCEQQEVSTWDRIDPRLESNDTTTVVPIGTMGLLYLEGTQARAAVQVLADQARQVLERTRLTRDLESERSARRATEQQAAELRRINEELHHFAHFASHELQEPLRAVAGYSRLLQQRAQDVLDDKSSGYLQRIQEATERMSSLTRDLLEFAELGARGLDLQRVNAAELLNQARHELGPLFEEARASLRRDELPWLEGDPLLLRLVFRSLLSNAVTFRRGSHPVVEVGARSDQGNVLLWFKDDGIGVPAEYCQEVFQPFRRLHTLEEYPGTGMGLALARRAVERHGGEIWMEPNAGLGVTVWVRLPTRGRP